MIKRLKEFLREVKVETRKTVFPSKDELLSSTWVVLVTVLIFAAFLGFVDQVLSRFVRMLIQ